MEFGEMLISTGVDALIKLIREKGRLEITLASRLLNIPISTIEEWAHSLEDEGIISIEYQLTKVYLKWVSPAEEMVEQERADLREEKFHLMQDIKDKDEKAQAQLKEVASLRGEFSANYSKIMARIDELGGKSAGMDQAKTAGEESYYKTVDMIEDLRGKVSELGDSVKFMHEQLEKTRNELMGSDIKEKLAGAEESGKRISTLKKELEAMEKEVQTSLGSISKVNVDVSGLKGPVEEIRRDYETLKKEMEDENELLKEVESTAKIVSDARGEINELKKSAQSAAKELDNVSGTVEEIEEKVAKASAHVRENREKAANFLEALKSTEETLGHFKMDEKAHAKMDALLRQGKALEEKMDTFHSSVEEALPLFENVEKLISSLSELRKKIGEERKKLAEESGAIFASLDEEVATYSTFQKIKEKAVHTINEYLTQLEKIEVNYEKAAQEAEKVEKRLDDSLAKFRESGQYKDVEKLSSSMDDLSKKKQLLEEISAKVDALDAAANKIAKQVKLLSKEAELVELRSSSAVPAEREQAKKGKEQLQESMSLTESEQKDFDEKREELRKLIKKLWEEE